MIENKSASNEFVVFQNYPNPFNPVTTLGYDLPEKGLVNIIIYDMLGNIITQLVNNVQSSGYKSIRWNATRQQRSAGILRGLFLYYRNR